MSRRFITGILTLAATITAFSAAGPARADSADDLRRLLGTAAGIYVTGRILNELANGAGGADVLVHDERRQGGGWGRRDGTRQADRWIENTNRYDQSGNRPRQNGNRQARKAPLPAVCMVRVDRQRTTFALPRRCLRRNYVGFNRLPDRCLMRIAPRHNRFGYGQGKPRAAYALRCLRQKGYRVARGW
ncbi:hypothetical protein [Cognatishimia sp. F0-27]|uniref:hypothetical protein n=1 Tax=Cognatishimia sp. F0-27 TaxID=2816855 RepID=UPI001D0C5458|nr:hypothetical protein [Cognatishimia sp. F0-27]MCC1494204.1 hypothetical protein [Cognatishimia sp. F0-27]